MPSRNRSAQSAPAIVKLAGVVDLATAREHRRLSRYREKAQVVLEKNRAALRQLFESGVVFTRHGSRVGRDLLQAHQNLMKVVDIASRPQKAGAAALARGDNLFRVIEELLEKTSVIEERNKAMFQSTTPGGF